MTNRNLLIVGASSGVGQALANNLDQDYAVWKASRSTADSEADKTLAWDAVSGDLPANRLPDVLDGLVYCPGSIRLQPFNRLSDDNFLEDFQLNLLGAVRALRGALSALKAAPHASVVMYSTVAVTTGMPMHASIAAAKGAIEGLTRSLAAEFAPDIRVNAIAPSLVDTPLAQGLLRTDRQREAAAKRHPLDRIGQAEDIAAATAYLLSDESSWMTGQVMHIDGGIGVTLRFA